jgi:hypothetical protein
MRSSENCSATVLWNNMQLKNIFMEILKNNKTSYVNMCNAKVMHMQNIQSSWYTEPD